MLMLQHQLVATLPLRPLKGDVYDRTKPAICLHFLHTTPKSLASDSDLHKAPVPHAWPRQTRVSLLEGVSSQAIERGGHRVGRERATPQSPRAG